MADVFISHARADAGIAHSLSEILLAHGLTVSFDEGSLAAGDHYSKAVEKSLLKARAVIVLLSRNSRRSNFVEQEVRVALEKGGVVVPVLLDEEAKENWIWPLLSNRAAIELKTPQEISGVARRIEESLGFVQRNRRLRTAAVALAGFWLIVVAVISFGFFRFQKQVKKLSLELSNSQQEVVALRAQLSKATLPLNKLRIVLTKPTNQDKVDHATMIEGTVMLSSSQRTNIVDLFRDGNAELVVFVRPTSTDAWWLQSSPQLTPDGTFRGTAFFGERNCGGEPEFEIVVLAAPKSSTGPVELPDLPFYYAHSRPVRVKCVN